jgi:hypothetical protein
VVARGCRLQVVDAIERQSFRKVARSWRLSANGRMTSASFWSTRNWGQFKHDAARLGSLRKEPIRSTESTTRDGRADRERVGEEDGVIAAP